jgi:hypothetical protein
MRSPDKTLPRRTVLRGLGTGLSLPLLDAMSAGRAAAGGASRTRFIGIEMVHGAAGSTAYGRQRNLWSPRQEGADFEFTPSLRALEPLRDYVTIVSQTALKGATSWTPEEDGDGVDHARSSATFLTGAHPSRNEAGIPAAGASIDQLYAAMIGTQTPIPSLQLAVESKDVANGPGDQAWPAGYSASYRQCLSWADAATPLPAERRPDILFARLFGAATLSGATSILDKVAPARRRLGQDLGAVDRRRLEAYFEQVRDVERRIRAIKSPAGVPDSFSDHVKLLADLQVLAFQCDITRVTTLKLGMDRSQRVYGESGVPTPFHQLSHHRQEPGRIEACSRLNAYHVAQVAYFLERLRDTPDGEDNLLHQSVVLYGSPMGDSHVHGHVDLPVFVAGHAGGGIRGNRHVVCAPDTPLANLLLTLARKLGVPADRIGDSDGVVAV